MDPRSFGWRPQGEGMFQDLLSINSAPVCWAGGICAVTLTRTSAASPFSVDQNYSRSTFYYWFRVRGVGGGGCFYQILSSSIQWFLNERKSLSVSDAYKWRCIGSVSRGFHLW